MQSAWKQHCTRSQTPRAKIKAGHFIGLILTLVMLPVISVASDSDSNTNADANSLAPSVKGSAANSEFDINITPKDQLTDVLAPSSLESQRNLYQQVRQQLSSKEITLAEIPFDQLEGYPLTPYLTFQSLSARLKERPYDEIDDFLYQQGDSWLAERLLTNWLQTLAAQRRWHDYQTYFHPSVNDTGLTCLNLAARIDGGDTEAFGEVAELWDQGTSLPKRCDPLFSRWLKSDYFLPEVAWSRYQKAVKNRKLTLARYIRSLMPAEMHFYADAMVDVYHYPSRIRRLHRQLNGDQASQDIIHYGIRRYAKHNPLDALKQWQKFDSAYLLEHQSRNETTEYLAYRLILDGHEKTASSLLKRNSIVSLRITERQLRDALKEGDWANVTALISELPEKQQTSHRWRYWATRAQEQLRAQPQDAIVASYQSLADARDFYGFLSAERANTNYTLGHRTAPATKEVLQQVANIPALQRSQELFKLGYINQARMEWRYGVRELSTEELIAAGMLAKNWGWHRKTIESLGQAKFWDDLNLRFPLIYNQEVSTAAKLSSIAPQFLLAIARQESAFAPDARSPAGAMGLMQLMPGTARDTAKSIGLPYRKADLYQPEHNFLLGSTYLSQMLERFGGNRILATAAYNAGPHRVNRWLNAKGHEVEYDIWIETIPYKETRGYVQNVLSYSLIYSHLMGIDSTLLEIQEKERPL